MRKEKLKVCHLTSVHQRTDTRIFYKMCTSLAYSGIDVTLIISDGNGNDYLNNVKVVDVGSQPKNKFKRMTKTVVNMYRKALEVDAAIYHLHDPELLTLGMLLKINGKKVVYDAHEDVPRQIENKHWIPIPLRNITAAIIEAVENFVARRLNAVVAATPLISNRFLKVNPVVVTIHNYPLLSEFLKVPLKKPLNRDLCYVGALTRERGIIELLSALTILSDTRLIACGPFESPAFEVELRQHSGWKYVDYRGIVSRDEVAEIIGNSQIGLVTLLPTPNQVESLPVKMFEYMASGTPVLASNFYLWNSIVEKSCSGRSVDPSKPELIANEIRNMLSDRNKLFLMGEAGRNITLHKYNWESEFSNLSDLYAQI
jgi:glycosyltransferase involved in cell wall biosynthesis